MASFHFCNNFFGFTHSAKHQHELELILSNNDPDWPQTLMTPVYGGGRSGYVPEASRAQTEMPINAPVYKGVQDKNQYNPQVIQKEVQLIC